MRSWGIGTGTVIRVSKVTITIVDPERGMEVRIPKAQVFPPKV